MTRSVQGNAMNSLAAAYGQLGRHHDALVLNEKVLESRRRRLLDNDPKIGVM
jgi:hypothetical protein